MDQEQLVDQFNELYEKYNELSKQQLDRQAFKLALEARRFAKTHKLLMPYLHACFSITNFAQNIFEHEIGADAALEIIALVEDEEKAKKFQNDFDQDHYEYTVHWISACAYDNLAVHTAKRNGYNSQVVHGAVDDGIHVCRRTGKLECVDCFREYAVRMCWASGDYEMGEHYARTCATSNARQNADNRRFIGYRDLVYLYVRQGKLNAAWEALCSAATFAESYHDPIGASIKISQWCERLCWLMGRESELPSMLAGLGLPEGMPSIPSQEDNPSHHLVAAENAAIILMCQKRSLEAEKILADEERFLLSCENIVDWFDIRLYRITALLMAKEMGQEPLTNVDALMEELRERAQRACQWSVLFALDAMLERRVPLNPCWIASPIDLGPFATEGTPISTSQLELMLPLIEKTTDNESEKIGKKDDNREKSVFEIEAEKWFEELMALWQEYEEHEESLQGQQDIEVEPFAKLDELNTAERHVYDRVLQLTPETTVGNNGETLNENEFLAASWPLQRMILLRSPERIKEVWKWLTSFSRKFADRGRVISGIAYQAFIYRQHAEKQGMDPISLGLPGKEEIEQRLQKAFELEPNRTGIATLGGQVFRAYGNIREAQRFFARACQIDRLNEFSTLALSEIYEQVERPKDAMATIELYTRAGGRHPGLLWQGMQIAVRNEMPQEFLLYFEAYTEKQPTYPMLEAQRLWALALRKRYTDIIPLLAHFAEKAGGVSSDQLLLRALCEAELGESTWPETIAEAMSLEENDAEGLIGTIFEPCEPLWNHVKTLPPDASVRIRFEPFLFVRGLVPSDYFYLDDGDENDGDTEENQLFGYYRCVLMQPLDGSKPVYAGWIRIPQESTSYVAIWLALAENEEEATQLAIEMQTRCHYLPASSLRCEQLDSYYAKHSQIVFQGRRMPPSDETNDSDDDTTDDTE